MELSQLNPIWTFLSLCVAFASSVELTQDYAQSKKYGAEKELEGVGPSRIYRAKTSMNGYKMIMSVRFTGTQIFDMYNFRVRWTEPFQWNDGGKQEDRKYDLICWLETEGEGNLVRRRTLFQQSVDWYFQGYNEKFRFPPDLDVWTQCKVRAINSNGDSSSWAKTNRLRVQNVPVYLPGLEGIDLRGLNADDITNVLAKVSVEAAQNEERKPQPPPRVTTTRGTTTRPTTTTPPTTTTTTIKTTTTSRATTARTKKVIWTKKPKKPIKLTPPPKKLGRLWPITTSRPKTAKPLPRFLDPQEGSGQEGSGQGPPPIPRSSSRSARRREQRRRNYARYGNPYGFGYRHMWE